MTTTTHTTWDGLQAAVVGSTEPATVAGAPRMVAPPLLTGGAKCLFDSATVGIDWLTMSGPGKNIFRALSMLEQYFGSTKTGGGRFMCDSSYRWAEGGVFYNQDDTQAHYCVVQLPGSLLAEVTQHKIQEIIDRLLDMGFHSTRLDIAVDLKEHEYLIPQVYQACNRGELVGARTWQSIMNISGGEMTALGCNIGKRGDKGSGRYLRIYDKGLEQQTDNLGEWVRWEAELSSDCASQAAEAIADTSDLAETLSSLAFGVVDFLDPNGKRRSRRPRSEWFANLLGKVQPVCVRKTRRKPTAESTAKWIERSVAPTLATLSKITGRTMDRLILQCCEKVPRPSADHLQKPFIRAMSIHNGIPPTSKEFAV